MASYLDKAKAAKKAGKGTRVSAPVWKPEKEGELFAGLLIDKESAHSQRFGSDFVVYTFQSDSGPQKWIPGAATDAEIKSIVEVGQVYLIEYQGKEATGAGNERNRYEVTLIPATEMAGA